MKLYVDLDTLQLIEGPGFRNPVTSLRFKRGDSASMEVGFLNAGSALTQIGDPANLELEFGVKLRGQYHADYLVHSDIWDLPDQGETHPSYGCSPSFNTVELDAALQVSTESELSEITLMGEITWRIGGGEPTSTRTFVVVVENDVNRGTEGVPTQANPPYPDPELLLLQTNLDWLDTKAVRHDVPQSLGTLQKSQAQENIGLAGALDSRIAFLDHDPRNSDLLEIVINGSLTSDGSVPLPTPSETLTEQWPYQWENSDWVVAQYYNDPSDWYVYHNPTGAFWYSNPGDSLENATWTPGDINTGEPSLGITLIASKNVGKAAIANDGVNPPAFWINKGTPEAPNWMRLIEKGEVAAKVSRSGDTITGQLLSTAGISGSASQVLNREQIKTLHKPSVDGVTLQISDPGATLQIESSQGYSTWWRVDQGSSGSGMTTVTITIDPWYRIAHFNSTWSSRLGSIAARLKIAGVANSNHSDAGFREWLLIGSNASGTTGKQLFGSGSGGSFPATTVTWSQASQSAPIVITATISASIFGGAVVALELL